MNFTISVFSVVDYPEVVTLQNWRPVSTWNTTSRLQTNKGKYVFTSRHPPPSLPLHPQQQQPQSFSRGDKQPQQPRRASIDENGGQMMSVITTPHMHFATLPRRPMQKVIKVTKRPSSSSWKEARPLNIKKVSPFFFKRFLNEEWMQFLFTNFSSYPTLKYCTQCLQIAHNVSLLINAKVISSTKFHKMVGSRLWNTFF